MKQEFFGHQKQRFSIRKYSFGAASVLLGSLLLFGNKTAMADDMSHCCCACSMKNHMVTEISHTSPIDQPVENTNSVVENPALEEVTQAGELNKVNSAQSADNALTSSVEITTNRLTPEKSPEINTDTAVESVEPKVMESEVETQPVVVEEIVKPSLPDKGTYTFKENTEVKNEAKVSAPMQFYYPKGDKVNYDKVLVNDGHQWLSYISFNGMRRYADLGKVETKVVAPKSETKPTVQTTPKVEAQPVVKETVKPSLPDKGTYTFKENTEVKNEAKVSAPMQFYYPKGDKVNYDKVLVNDGHQWLSYISFNGMRRYAALGKVETKVVAPKSETKPTVQPTPKAKTQPVALTLAPQGTYTFKENTEVKNEAKVSASTQFYYPKGDKVNYDKVLVNDGHQWLSYISFNGMRRYADLGKVETKVVAPKSETKPTVQTTPKAEAQPVVKETVKLSIPAQGTYRFEKTAAVKNEARVAATTQFHFDKGESVNYDKVLTNDNHNWISYISYSGTRRYVDLGQVVTREVTKGDSSSQGKEIDSSAISPISKPTEVKLTGNIHVENQSEKGFDIVISDISTPKKLSEILVPTWTTQDGQDDLQWYKATEEATGRYKVSVNISNHKNKAGEYNIHLYYRQNDGQLTFVTKTTTEVKAAVSTANKEVTYKGSYYSIQGKYDEIVIANKKYPLASTYNPGENPKAREAFIRLRNDMINQGFNVGKTYSGFRSYEIQKSLYQTYANSDGSAAADRYSARAGHSEHQTGLAYDFTDKSGRLLEDKAAADWLQQNAHKYGFVVRYLPGKEAVTGYMERTMACEIYRKRS
ncbi:SH3 domain-containing protein [Streptococcus hillyeri]|uniref:SH3 domain-containing protein n=1 Tax=Streptococcus hillyeri TaxID=2282420 RepID=UPI001FE2BF43|nr:SH3 domain-containing protein [Streptococcus hillyeri]